MSTNKSTSKGGKSSSGNQVNSNNASGLGRIPALVPPVLREVSKLAAGVASVSTTVTAGGSATGK